MKKIFLTLLLCTLPVFALAQLSDVPEAPKVDAKYIIYLHGVGIEKVGIAKANEDYYSIVKAFEGRGFIVISEVRSFNTKVNEYGKKVAGQVMGLIAKGVPPENVTVVGYSKGGLITLWAAAAGENPNVNYAVLAGCVLKGSENYDTYVNKVAPKLKGRILSLFDTADPDRGTCKVFFEAAGNKVTNKEIKFETGTGHGLFGKPVDKWMNPLTDWANGKN